MVDYSQLTNAISVDLRSGDAESSVSGTDTLFGVEGVFRSGDDTIIGSDANDMLDGGLGSIP